MTNNHRSKYQKGTVLITVMLMVAVAALIASEIAYRQQMDILRTGAFLSRDAAENYLMGAEEIGLFALYKDRKEDEKNLRSSNPVEVRDHLGEEWNKGGMFPLPGGIGIVEGKLYDLQARLNINSLMDSDADRRRVYRNTFTAIINNVLRDHPDAFPENTTANMLLERVVDWLDEDQTVTGFDGMEDDDYFRKEHPYRTANQVMFDASELLLVEGFTPQSLSFLEDKFSFLPPDAKINLYTAAENKDFLIQLGFDPGQVEDFANNQIPLKFKQPFKVEYKDLNEVYAFLIGGAGAPGAAPNPQNPIPAPVPGGPPVPGATKLQVDMFDIKSQYFLLKGKAVVNGKPVLVESVIWRPELNPPAGAGGGPAANPVQNIEPTTILRKFVDPLKQTN